jgi:hypothetical protein
MTKVIEINGITGQVIEREPTQAEMDQRTKDATKRTALAKAQADAQTAKDKSRQIILDRLGITADEAALLFG